MKKQSGFTLVEIAIVLVIIGLLLGGVLKGQELINSAKIKNIANDLNGVTAAVYGYQDRYKAFPGDDAGAKARWSLTYGDDAVTQNGQIAGNFNSSTADEESRLFWLHLRKAGLIGGDATSQAQPQNAVGGIVGAQMNAGNQASPGSLSGLVVCTSNLSGKIAEALDSQLDDGKANGGGLVGFTQSGVVTGAGGEENPAGSSVTVATAYTDDGTTLYTVCRKL